MIASAEAVHREIHHYCFIARSLNLPVEYAAAYVEEEASVCE